jgi:hypothetical protein
MISVIGSSTKGSGFFISITLLWLMGGVSFPFLCGRLTAWEQLTGGYTAYSLNTTFNHNSDVIIE